MPAASLLLVVFGRVAGAARNAIYLGSMATDLPARIGPFLRRELRSLRRELEAYPDERLIWSLPFPEPIRDRHLQTGDLLLQLAVHLAYHLGQVSYHRRLVTGDVRGVGALSAAELVPAGSILHSSGG